jgi:hypothetical protein
MTEYYCEIDISCRCAGPGGLILRKIRYQYQPFFEIEFGLVDAEDCVKNCVKISTVNSLFTQVLMY